MSMLRSQYWKSVIPAIATVLALFLPLLFGTAAHGIQDWINVIILALGTVGTWIATNMSEGVARYAKEIIGALTAGAVLLSSLASDGISHDEWMQVILAILMALLLPLKGNDGYVHGIKPGAGPQVVPNG
jgi:hypothetical protein